MKNPIAALVITAVAAVSMPSLAASEHDAHHGAAATSAAAPASSTLVDGIVKKVDKASGKLTLSHGPLTNLGMPAMTMVFRVKEAAWLDQMTIGKKIRFVADQIDGVLTVVALEAAK